MITVIGLGFVGLTTALGFAHKGFSVYGYDLDVEKIALLKAKKIPHYEPWVQEQLEKYSGSQFFVSDSLEQALNQSQLIFFCVGTPTSQEGKTDFSYLKHALEETLKKLGKQKYKVIVIKSTVPPSSTQKKIKSFIEQFGFCVGKEIGLANNPEFLREGYAWEDFIHPDRIVIGQYDKQSGDLLEEVYQDFKAPIYRVTLNTAEFIKYLSNTFLSTAISFSNEMAILARSIGGIDIAQSFRIFHQDKRWQGHPAGMSQYVYPGCGFGGSCLKKDTESLLSVSKDKGAASLLLKEVLEINNKVKKFVVNQITEVHRKDIIIGILGLSFKPNTDDVRDTPAKEIIQMLLNKGYQNIIAYDPMARRNFQNTFNLSIDYAATLDEIIQKASLLLILTSWQEFFDQRHKFQDKEVLDFRYFI